MIIIMRNFTVFLLLIFLSSMGFSQGHETFDNFDYDGSSYQDGSFEGQDGSTWEYLQSRGDTDIKGSTLMLGRNRTPDAELTSGTISGGIGTLQFSYMQPFTNDVEMEGYVNGELIYTATTDNEQNDIETTGEIEVNVDGDFTLEFANPDGAQVLIDDIIWTAHGADEDCMASVPFTEGFENGIPDCWTQEYVSGNADWNVVSENQNGTVTPHSGSQMAEFRVASFAGETTKLISPQLDLTSLDNPQLSFYFANADWSGDVDELRVYYKTSSDSDWIQIGDDYTDVHESWTPVELALPEPSAT